MVPEGGFEPPHPKGHRILNPARLPFHHSGYILSRFHEITYGPVIGAFLFSGKKTRGKLTVASVIMQAFAAFMLPGTGFISAVAMLGVISNIAFHRLDLLFFVQLRYINVAQ